MDILIGLILAISAIVIFIYVRIARYQLSVLHDRETSVRAFHKAAASLVKDDETPDEILELLQFLNRKITDRSAAGHLYYFIRRGRFTAFTRQSGKTDKHLATVRAFFVRRPELEKPFHVAVGSALLAMTFINYCYGQKVRVWLAGIETGKGQEEVVAAYQCLDRNAPKGPTCLAPI